MLKNGCNTLYCELSKDGKTFMPSWRYGM